MKMDASDSVHHPVTLRVKAAETLSAALNTDQKLALRLTKPRQMPTRLVKKYIEESNANDGYSSNAKVALYLAKNLRCEDLKTVSITIFFYCGRRKLFRVCRLLATNFVLWWPSLQGKRAELLSVQNKVCTASSSDCGNSMRKVVKRCERKTGDIMLPMTAVEDIFENVSG